MQLMVAPAGMAEWVVLPERPASAAVRAAMPARAALVVAGEPLPKVERPAVTAPLVRTVPVVRLVRPS